MLFIFNCTILIAKLTKEYRQKDCSVPIFMTIESSNKRSNRVSMISLELDLTGDFNLFPV